MIKRKFKITLAILAILCIFFTSFSYATEENFNLLLNDNVLTNDEEAIENSNTDSSIIDHDLYLFDETIVLNDSVDGNVYAMGNDITITGRINGNLYALGNNIKIQSSSDDEECYITGSVYLCGNQILFNALCTDLYVASNNFTGSYNSYIDRDLKLGCENAAFYGLVARNAYISAENLSFTSAETGDSALISGNLEYSSETELSIDESIVNGEILFNQIIKNIDTDNSKSIEDYIKGAIASLICTLVIYLLLSWLTPKFKDNSKQYIGIKLLPAFGIGFASLILIPIASIILLITLVGIPLSVSLLLLYIVLMIISLPIVVISTTEFIKEKLNSKNLGTDLLILACVNIILYLLKQIPFIGGWIGFISLLIGMGIVVMYLFTKNKNDKNENNEVVKTNE